MNSKPSTMKSIMLIAALAAGVSGIARADDNSMNPYTGDSYAYFNGGNLPQGGKPVISKAPSTFHVTNPHGLPFSTYAELSSSEWPLPVRAVPRALASTDDAGVAKSAATASLGTRIAQFFHVNTTSAASAN